MPIVLKALLNVFLFILYLIVAIIFWNFLYWAALNFSWKIIPGPNDPVHMKIALLILVIVFIFTLIFRKIFYVNLFKKKERDEVIEEFVPSSMLKNISPEEEIKDNKDEIEEIKEILSNKIKEEKVEKKPKKKTRKKEEKLVDNPEWMQIFMGKEIK